MPNISRGVIWAVAINLAMIAFGLFISWALPKQTYILKSPTPRMIDGGWFGTIRAEYRMRETTEGWMLFRNGHWVLWEYDDAQEGRDE